jgi:hypothetical protein
MLATYWEAECGRSECEAHKRAERFGALAQDAWQPRPSASLPR